VGPVPGAGPELGPTAHPRRAPAHSAGAVTYTTEPTQRIRPPRRFPRPGFRELWEARELLWTLSVRDVTVRFRQTALGAVWIVLGPLVSAGIFTFLFGRVADLPSNGIPYFPFAYAGLLGWNVFSGTLIKSATSLTSNAALLTKIYFPRMVLSLASVLGTLINFAISGAVMAVLLVAYDIGVTWRLALLPVWLILVLLLSLGIGFMLAGADVSWRDISAFTPVLTSLLLYVTPVAYATSAVPANLRSVYLLNPLSSLLEGFRWSLFGTGSLRPGYVAYSVAWCVLAPVIGAFAFTKMEVRFADVV
jgi:lipopolysaccharide transport system permease protein